jgi:hypothetical protein
MDHLGMIECPLLWIPKPSEAHSQWFALKDIHGETYAGGDIQIRASFKYVPHLSLGKSSLSLPLLVALRYSFWNRSLVVLLHVVCVIYVYSACFIQICLARISTTPLFVFVEVVILF